MTQLIVALDFSDLSNLCNLASKLDPTKCKVKVGFEMFIKEGRYPITWLHQHGFDVFLDLKLKDIPNTVAAAIKNIADMGVWMTNVHAQGGVPMMEAAVEAKNKTNPEMLLTAVTVLTSLGVEELDELGIPTPTSLLVQRYMRLAGKAGLDAVVCSALDLKSIKIDRELRAAGHFKGAHPDQRDEPKKLLTVCPGIRLRKIPKEDQNRILTPKKAKEAGADFIVVGRPITQSKNPTKTVDNIFKSIT